MIIIFGNVCVTQAVVIWDNNINTNGVDARALSPPGFPDIRVADDFTISPGDIITDFHATVLEDDAWSPGTDLELTIYDDSGSQPGNMVTQVVTTNWTSTPTGGNFFGRDAYTYSVDGLNISLPGSSYWIGFRNPLGLGANTNWWLTSNGGPHGASSSTGYVSIDAGLIWTPEGTTWHHAFEITGRPGNPIPEPTTMLLFGSGLIGLTGFRRRFKS